MKYKNRGLSPREEELKNCVARDFFPAFDCTSILQNVDFSVKVKSNEQTSFWQYFLWAEAKKDSTDIIIMLSQLVLTIGKARTFDKILPPSFLGCFDCEKIAFVPYHEFQEIFSTNDFNWNVAPNKHETREFKLICEMLKKVIDDKKIFIFNFEKDEKELKRFIKENFIAGKIEASKIKIDKNNFIHFYNKWLETVKPTIMLLNWEKAKKAGIIDGDFYLADLLSSENQTLKEKLFVVLKTNKYELNRHENEMGIFTSSQVDFSDNQRAHTKFWAIYERPPKEEYWDYIIDHRHLLVPQDVRERKGSYYTPKIWVELSQKYISDVFGKDWQDEYYVWDCAAGTGNLLAGLTNKYNIYASTLDKADVDVMRDRIDNGANLLHEHVFQFDFLNDDFEKLPADLQKIIKKTPEKLIIYINPPYAEAMNKKDTKNAKNDVSRTIIEKRYTGFISNYSTRELYAQFLIRAYKEIQRCKIANFATLKTLSASNFDSFREFFQPKLEKLFVVPADTFDNVNGDFPIGFHIWNCNKKEKFTEITADVYDKNGNNLRTKNFYSYQKRTLVIDWLRKYYDKSEFIAYLRMQGTDIQHNIGIFIANKLSENDIIKHLYTIITPNNLIVMCIYLTIRKVIPADWLNDRDQFLYPNEKWENDLEFQSDCLTFTLFHNSNNISSKEGVNHWIPFTETEVCAQNKFESSFMTDFIAGKIKRETNENNLFDNNGVAVQNGGVEDNPPQKNVPLIFSPEAKQVFDAGRELWKYYHSKHKVNVNASFYDIREYFQGRNEAGRMNGKSEDEKYMELLGNLREKMKILAKKIEPKVYEYGFLRI